MNSTKKTQPKPGKSEENSELPPQITESLNQSCTWRGDTQLAVSFCGTDRAGMIAHFAAQVAAFGVTITSGFTSRLNHDFSGSFFLVNGMPNELKEFKSHVESPENQVFTGNIVLGNEIAELNIQCRDRVSLLADISSLLSEHNANIVSMGVRAFSSTGYLDNVIEGVAFFNFRIEYQSAGEKLKELLKRLRAIDPSIDIEVLRGKARDWSAQNN